MTFFANGQDYPDGLACSKEGGVVKKLFADMT